MRLKKYKVFFFFIFLTLNVNSAEIKILASINNQSITNYDLFYEIKLQELLNNTKINISQHNLVLQQIIEETIKKIEVNNMNIAADDKQVSERFKKILSGLPKEIEISEEIKTNIKNKIKNSIKWNNLILSKYRNKIEVNTNEIEEIMKSKNINDKNMDQITVIEKNKKLNVFSKVYFNEIKKKYFIQYY